MLGDLPLSKHNKIVNLIILWTKEFLFLCLMQKKIPVFTALLCRIRIKYKVEKHISIQKNKTSSFSTMWSVWKTVLDV